MARNAFGGSVSDYVVSFYTLGSSKLAAFTAATLTFFDAETGGNQVTDLALSVDGSSPMTQVNVPATGDVPTFYGPDGVTQLWVSANGSSSRVKMVSLEAAAAAVTGAQAAASEAAGHATDAASSATDAAAAAATATAPTDTTMASKINTAGSATRVALDAAIVSGLSDRFRRKITALDAANLNALHIGDSITEGFGSSGPQKRWIDQLRIKAKAKYQPPTILGGPGYIPVGGVYPSLQPGDWTLSGATASVNQSEGFGGSYANMVTSGQTASLTFTGTGVILFYTSYWAGPNPTVTIDGTTVDPIPLESSNVGTIYGKAKAYTNLARGSHTLVVTVGTTPLHLYGGLVLDGDATTGWRTIVGARSGSVAPGPGTGLSVWNYADPSLVTIYFGTNDYKTNVTPATFQSNLSTTVDRVKARSLNPKIVLIKGYEPAWGGTGSPVAPWSAYRDAVQAVADAQKVLCCDLQTKFGTGIISSTYSADSIHPNDTGHGMVADAIMATLGI